MAELEFRAEFHQFQELSWSWAALGSTVAVVLAWKIFNLKTQSAHCKCNDPFSQDDRRPAAPRDADEAVRDRVLRTGITDQVAEHWDAIVIGMIA